ncbi:MAG: carboxypeptidase-like regulatory domain-containing protein [Bacteroidia bacterium]|nr:carboxypeptidase-like regulatory domain-containing protein [Bacteroidia bacterium]
MSKIKGRVINESTEEPVPYANVLLKGSNTGASCDSLGKFNFSTSGRPDTILVSAMGYIMQVVPLSPLPDQTIVVRLIPSEYSLNEVTIRAGENPAFEILRKVIANKSFNNPENLEAYEFEAYHKVEFDLNHFTDRIRQNIFLRSFSFIFDNTDTTADGVTYLPILFNESTSEVYYRKNPKVNKEIVNGRRSVGLKGPKIVKFVEDMYLYPNIYENYVLILDKNFPSPINDNFKANYKFYLIDSLYLGNERCYHIQFSPRVKQDVAFTGEMYIEDSGYSIKQIDLQFSIEANVNFVRNYWIRQEYTKMDGTYSMIEKSQVIADFTVAENSEELTGFFGRKTSSFRNYKINNPREDNFYKGLDLTTFHDSSALRTEEYWQEIRQDSLTKQEQSVFSMIDTLNKNKKFNLLKNSVNAITTGWIPRDKISFGNVYTFYSYNDVEHSRFKFGFRLDELFKNRLSLKTYLAYGVYDERFKYLLEGNFILTKNGSKKTIIGGKIGRDASQPGRSSNMFSIDHILNSLTNMSALKYRIYSEEYNVFLERQWFTGFSSRLSFFNADIMPFGNYNFWMYNSEGNIVEKSSFTNSGFQLSARYAYGERNLSAKFGDGLEALYFPKFPVLSLNYSHSVKDLSSGEFDFQKLQLRLEHKMRMKKIGFSLLRLEAGKIWGAAPWPFLETPLANQIIFNDETAFNLMNYLEFVSDQYLSVMFEHHFEGLLFNRLPVLNKLKWREFVFAKAYAGSLSTQNQNNPVIIPNDINKLTEPYYETGFGIENIFKISRIDFIWRLNYTEKPEVYYFIVKPSFQFKF